MLHLPSNLPATATGGDSQVAQKTFGMLRHAQHETFSIISRFSPFVQVLEGRAVGFSGLCSSSQNNRIFFFWLSPSTPHQLPCVIADQTPG
jgi:hypothetical protein